MEDATLRRMIAEAGLDPDDVLTFAGDEETLRRKIEQAGFDSEEVLGFARAAERAFMIPWGGNWIEEPERSTDHETSS